MFDISDSESRGCSGAERMFLPGLFFFTWLVDPHLVRVGPLLKERAKFLKQISPIV